MVTVDDWKKHKDLLAAAIELDPDKRQKFFDESGIDGEARAEIESLLSLQDDAADFLSVPAGSFSNDFFIENGNGHQPSQRRLGIYEITREIGAGGMGAVFLAERRDGKFSQAVAIKMLRREYNTAAIRRNFEREKDILAALSHPNIGSLLDTGTTDDGVPYLVMEYVDGMPVDEFCFKNDLDLNARLKLFNKICDSVAFAHRNLIVHRDIKPSNILITSDGIPKLLDFGISKILDADSGDSATTLHGAMTPEYASPEQINGQTVTTATDVYSLGIVLYKMLTGAHPFKNAGQSNNELFKAITDDEPTAPSAAQDQNANPHSAIRIPHLEGDLDNIILKSIRKNPERRYGSVEQFSADIWRYIDGQPVEARAATRIYRLSRFYRRNKIAVTAALLIFAALVAGITVALRQTSVARANAAAAVIESDNAKAEQKKSEKISKFMMKIISYANPHWHAEGYRFGGEARVIEALDDMASRIDSEFADQPDVLAELHHQFCDAYNFRTEPGASAKARTHALRALELRRSYYGDWHELVAKDMAYVYWTGDAIKTDADVQLLSDAIVMMRATNPKNLNLPFMLEAYFHQLAGDNRAEFRDMFLRHIPQPAPSDKYLAADQLFDEMLGLLRLHFAEDSVQVVTQKCVGMALKFKINKTAEADDFYQACAKSNEQLLSIGKPSLKWQKQLADYKRIRGGQD
ncbi:MAG: serine/threonine-protein kinase [Pyrinomonadaceae bacterium]